MVLAVAAKAIYGRVGTFDLGFDDECWILDVGLGLPGLTIVGRASGALTEARERVRSAIGHCGHKIHPRKQVVNLAPADERKDSPGIDLAVACALLASHEVVPWQRLTGLMLWGELALDGTLRPAAGTLVVADCARRAGFVALAVPRESADEAALIPGLVVYALESLPQLVAHLRGEVELAGHVRAERDDDGVRAGEGDMGDIRGLSLARLTTVVSAGRLGRAGGAGSQTQRSAAWATAKPPSASHWPRRWRPISRWRRWPGACWVPSCHSSRVRRARPSPRGSRRTSKSACSPHAERVWASSTTSLQRASPVARERRLRVAVGRSR